jgi:hypothetical protein
VIYGAGASHASGYKVNLGNEAEEPFMDRGFFGQPSIKGLLDKGEYPAIKMFIELYFNGRDDVGLEELWSAVDLNHKHITLDTYDWAEETEKYCRKVGWRLLSIRRGHSNEFDHPINKHKFLGDCGRELKELIFQAFSKFTRDGDNTCYRSLHEEIGRCGGLRGYITFNYDLMLEDSLVSKGVKTYRYVNVNEDTSSPDFLSKGGVPVIKLHGSLNWRFVSSVKPVKHEENAVKPDYAGGHDGYVEPAIIPPTLFKQEINDDSRSGHSLTQAILAQWRAAVTLLAEADKWIFVGYSFPPTDFHASRIFHIAMMRPPKSRRRRRILYCGGPDENESEIVEKFKKFSAMPIIKNDFKELCTGDELRVFLTGPA